MLQQQQGQELQGLQLVQEQQLAPHASQQLLEQLSVITTLLFRAAAAAGAGANLILQQRYAT